MKRTIRILAWCSLAALLAAGGAGLCAASPTAATITTNVNLRRAPGLEGRIITGLDKGEQVTVFRRAQDWCLVEVSGSGYGYRGWVYAKYVAPIEATAPAPAMATAKHLTDKRAVAAKRPAEPKPIKAPSEPVAEPTPAPKDGGKTTAAGPDGPRAEPAATSVRPAGSGRAEPAGSAPALWHAESPAKHAAANPFSLALRMATVLLSCTALLFSYRALQISRHGS